MGQKSETINISLIQYFIGGEYNDTDYLEPLDSNLIDDANVLEPLDNNPDYTEINISCFDNRDDDELIQPLPCVNVKSKSLDICTNHPETPTGITNGVIAKIPIVLAQLTVPFHISLTINLPEPILEIKDIKKNLKVTQCILLQPTNVLFIKGFIQKNIKYSIKTCSTIEGLYGDIRHFSLDIPFECTTIVNFLRQPKSPFSNTRSNFGYHIEKNLPNDTFAESKFNQKSEEFFNEPPFCKLLSSRIVELNELITSKPPSYIDSPFEEKSFVQIEEKMVIELKLEILQNQNVVVPSITNNIDE